MGQEEGGLWSEGPLSLPSHGTEESEDGPSVGCVGRGPPRVEVTRRGAKGCQGVDREGTESAGRVRVESGPSPKVPLPLVVGPGPPVVSSGSATDAPRTLVTVTLSLL